MDLSRRQFVAGGLAGILSTQLPDLYARQEDDKWVKAQKDAKLQQTTLDDALKSDKDACSAVKRYYNVEVVELSDDEAKKTRDKYAFIWGNKALKFSDAAAEKELKDVFKQHAKAYVAAKKLTAKTAEDDSYKYLVAQAIDQSLNAKDAFVFLLPELWGNKVVPVGFATPAFWAEASYKTDDDRKSTLLDNLPQKARDMFNNVKVNELWKDTMNTNPLSTYYTDFASSSMRDMFVGIFLSRSYVAQYDKVAERKRKLSPERLKKVAGEWENLKEFRAIIKNEQGIYKSESMSGHDEMSKMGFKYLPWQGEIVLYSVEKVKEYKFEK